MTIKFKAENVTFTDMLPALTTADMFAVLGVRKLSLYVEPADTSVTGYVAYIGYTYRGDMALDPDRVLYSSRDVVKARLAVDSSVGIDERRATMGVYKEFRVPSGARNAYVWIVATGGAVNYQVGS